MNTVLSEALLHLDRGFALLPVRGKEPASNLIRATRGRASWRQLVSSPASATEVHNWLELDPKVGVGVLTGEVSKVVVVDVDEPTRAPDVPTTPTVATSRGFHAYFRADQSVRTRELEWGSIRGDRSYVVAPNSRRSDGGTYAWQLSPEEAGFFADFATFDPGDSPTYIGSTSLLLSSTRPTLERQPLAGLERDERLALRLAAALGVPSDAQIGQAFPCLLHADDRPSASLWRYEEDANVLYHDFHAGKHGSAGWLPLAAVRARLAGRDNRLAAPELAVWKLRLCAEAELIEPVPLERLPAPASHLEDVWQGFLDLLALRWLVTRGAPAPFSARFAAAWCGVPKRHAHEAIRELQRYGSLTPAGRDPRGTSLWLPEGVRPVD